jgi:Flp pilus assembly protein TadD
MQPLAPPDTHYLSAAVGWIELGNFGEARNELDRISSGAKQHRDVLELRWFMYAQEDNWEEGLRVANAMLELASEDPALWLNRAYALRRVQSGGLQAAWDALLPAFEKFPKETTIPYNLACYACQMNRLDEARQWLQRALSTDSDNEKVKRMALNDSDLEPLWDEIRKL